MIEVVPSNTCPRDFDELSRRSESFSKYATQVHLDVADAKFAPTLSWPYQGTQWNELESMAQQGDKLPYADELFYEAHLMVADPAEIGRLLAHVGCKRIIAHVETLKDEATTKTTFDSWRASGAAEVGIAIRSETPLEALDPYILWCNSVTLMSIATIGAQGIPFDERAYPRVGDLHARYPDLVIEVDGGVGEAQLLGLARAGAQRFSIGSAISRSPDPAAEYQKLLALAKSAV